MTVNSGFKVTGIYPVDRCVVQVPGQKLSFRLESLAEMPDLAYVPLYSTAPTRHNQKPKMITFEASGMSSLSDSLHQSFLNSVSLLILLSFRGLFQKII